MHACAVATGARAQDIVASANLGGKIDLEKIIKNRSKEKLVIKYKQKKSFLDRKQAISITFPAHKSWGEITIFANGKMIIKGAPTEANIHRFIHSFHQKLEDKKLIHYG